jgi:hypothetical protein
MQKETLRKRFPLLKYWFLIILTAANNRLDSKQLGQGFFYAL